MTTAPIALSGHTSANSRFDGLTPSRSHNFLRTPMVTSTASRASSGVRK